MIENMGNKYILDKARMEGMNQGIWLAVQELAHDGRWTQAAEELVSSCGLTEDECRELQEESGSFNDEMLDFINSVFGHEDMINNSITLENIGYQRKRYDMAFATFIVDNMRKQNMLKEDKIAELLKDNPNEKYGRCQKRAAISAHDAASAEKGRGIIPGMV